MPDRQPAASESPYAAHLAAFDALGRGRGNEGTLRAWRLSPDPLLWLFAAVALSQLDRPREARRLFCPPGRQSEGHPCNERALQLGRKRVRGRVAAGGLVLEAGAFAAAEVQAQTAASLDPTSTAAHLIVGQLRLWHGDADG